MRDMGLTVDRPVYPISLELSKVETELQDPNAHPIKVPSLLLVAGRSKYIFVGGFEAWG